MPDNRIPQKGGEERAITRLKLMHALGVTTSTDDVKPLRPGPVFFLDETGQFVVSLLRTSTLIRRNILPLARFTYAEDTYASVTSTPIL